MKPKPRRRMLYIRVPDYERREVPEAALRLARERVGYLAVLGATLCEPVELTLASAYLQGVVDAGQLFANHGLTLPDSKNESAPGTGNTP